MTTPETTATGGKASDITTKMDDEDTMDALVRDASVPNLAALFQAGKDAGLIKPGVEYGHTT